MANGGITIIILYFLIGLIASTFGAIAGLGGGVIIKPVLDFFGHYDLATIGILSSSTVLSMATVSLIQSKKLNIKINKVISSIIAFGSIIGGLLGKGIFNYLTHHLNISEAVAIFQSSLLALLMVAILLLTKYVNRHYVIKQKVVIFSVGLILGLLSAFLGIGGGPLNVVVLRLLFSMSPKESSFNSIFIIFFSQLSSLLLTSIGTGFSEFDLSMLLYIISGGVLGGWIGANLTRFITNQQVQKIFSIAIFIMLFINIYNVIHAVI